MTRSNNEEEMPSVVPSLNAMATEVSLSKSSPKTPSSIFETLKSDVQLRNAFQAGYSG